VWHYALIQQIVAQLPSYFLGTSNVLLAKEFNVTPIGTMAHEWLQAGQALTRIRDSQKFMLQKWADVYRGDLGIALSDVVGVDAFIRDFDLYFAKLFDGCRQDSGCPFEWGEKIIQMYKDLRIDPATKVAVFSDSLDISKAKKLYDRFHGRLKIMFGIGTNLTNDVGVEPLNIVIKMVSCNGMPVAKIADGNGTKGMCEDDEYLKYLKSQFLIAE
jgi:nicotinate phosphoribosyltransferase